MAVDENFTGWAPSSGSPSSFGTEEATKPRPQTGDANFDSFTPGAQVAQQPQVLNMPTLTGQNLLGTNNAFDTGFWEKATEQDNEQRTGKLPMTARWQRPDATGVVIYDDPNGDLKFGDVFVNGDRVGNMYEGYGGITSSQADEMMMRMSGRREAWAKAYEAEAGKPLTGASSLSEEVQRFRQESSENYAKGLSAAEFEGKVKDKAKAYSEDGAVQAANVAGHVAGGAGVGAALGTVLPGIGTLIGAGVGGIIGGIGAWLNQDETLRNIAQFNVQQEMAEADDNEFLGMMDWAKGAAGVAGRTLNPANNLYHGLYDLLGGEVGDQSSTRDDTARSGIAWAADMGLDTATLIVDGMGTFASKLARMAFTGIMGATTAAGTGSVLSGAANDNTLFNPYTGRYEDVGLKGTLLQAGSVGIDAAQTGAGAMVGRLTRSFGKNRGAESIGGHLIQTGADGTRTATRIGFSALIPSEAATGLSARALARRVANREGARSGTKVSKERYQQILAKEIDNLATGAKTLPTAIVNGFGEGAEEFVQAGLDALSVGEMPTLQQLFDASRAGFGMGVGMGAAIGRGRVSADQRLHAQAQVANMALGLNPVSETEWAKMSPADKARAGTLPSNSTKGVLQAVAGPIAAAGYQTVTANVPESRALLAAAERAKIREYATASRTSDSPRRQTIAGPEWGPQDYVVSLDAARNDAAKQLEFLQAIVDGKKIHSDKVNPLAPEALSKLPEIMDMKRGLVAELDRARAAFDAAQTPAEKTKVIAELNKNLRSWYRDDSRLSYGRQRAVTMIGARYPLNSTSSFQALQLQISPELTAGGDTTTVIISDGIQESIGGDYDGDQFVNMLHIVMPDASFENMRSGTNMLTAEGALFATRPFTAGMVREIYKTLAKPGTTAYGQASAALDEIAAELTGLLKQTTMLPSQRERHIATLRSRLAAGDSEAIKEFVEVLYREHAPQMRELAKVMVYSPVLAIPRRVDDLLYKFANLQAYRAPSSTPRKYAGGIDAPVPVKATPKVSKAVAAGSSDMQTMSNITGQTELLRAKMALKYSSRREQTRTWDEEAESDLAALVEKFTMTNDGMVDPGEVEMHKAVAIQQRVKKFFETKAREDLLGLPGMSEFDTTQLAMIYALGVVAPDIEMSTGRQRTHGRVVPLQLAIQQAVTAERMRSAVVLQSDEALAARLAGLERLTAPTYVVDGTSHSSRGEAFVEIYGGEQLTELLGPDAAGFGALSTMTVAGLRDTLQVMPYQERADYEAQIRAHNEWGNDRIIEGMRIPSPYELVMDAIMESAHQRLSIDSKGDVHGTLANSSARAGQDLNDLGKSLRTTVGRTLGTVNKDTVRQYLAEHAGPATLEKIVAIFEDQGLLARSWMSENRIAFPEAIYDILAETNSDTMQLRLLAYIINAKRDALKLEAEFNAKKPKSAKENEAVKIEAMKTNDRLLRLYLDLLYQANDETNPRRLDSVRALTRFVEALNSRTSGMKQFMRMLNTDPEFHRGDRAPYLPWNRDRAALEPNRYGKGVSDVLDGAAVRQSIQEATRAAAMELRTSEALDAFTEVSMPYIDRLIEAKNSVPGDPDYQLRQNFEAFFEHVTSLPKAIGTSVILHNASMQGMIQGGQGAKGVAPETAALLGTAIAGQLSTRDYGVGRVLGSLRAGNLAEVLQSPTALREARTIVSPDGTVIHVDEITPGQALEMLKDPGMRGFMQLLLGMATYTVDPETNTVRLSTTFALGEDSVESAFGEGLFGNSDFAKHRRLNMLGAMIAEDGTPPDLAIDVAQMLVSRETGATAPWSPAKRGDVANEIAMLEAEVLQQLSELESPTALVEDPETGLSMPRINLAVYQAVRRARAAQGNAMSALIPTKPGKEQDLAIEMLNAAAKALIARTVETGNKAGEDIARFLQQQVSELGRDHSPLDVVYAAYSNYTDPAVQQMLRSAIETHGGIVTRVPQNAAVLINEMLSDPDMPVTDAEWELVARAVISYTMHTNYGVQSDEKNNIPLFPELNDKGGNKELREREMIAWDPTFIAPVVDALIPGLMQDPAGAKPSNLLAANLELVAEKGGHLPRRSIDTVSQKVYSMVAPARKTAAGETFSLFGKWNSTVPALTRDALGDVNASPAGAAISMPGIEPDRMRYVGATTVRNWAERPDDALASVATVSLAQLDAALDKGKAIDPLDSMIDVDLLGDGTTSEMSLALLEGRLAIGAEITVNTAAGPQTRNLLAGTLTIGNHLPANRVQVPPTEAQVVTLEHLAAAARRVASEVKNPVGGVGPATTITLRFFHPSRKVEGSQDAISHNPWFDGVAGANDSMFVEPSLIGQFLFGAGRAVPNEYTVALQAVKKLKSALSTATTMNGKMLRAMTESALQDPAGFIHQLTTFALRQPVAGKPMGYKQINAIRKLLTLSYVVRYVDADGFPAVMSFDQVLAMQARGEVFPPDSQAEAVGLPIEHLLTLMGEVDYAQINQAGLSERAFTPQAAGAPQYTNFPENAWTERLPGLVRRNEDGTGWYTEKLQDQRELRNLPVPGRVATPKTTGTGTGLRSSWRTEMLEHRDVVHAERLRDNQASRRWQEQAYNVSEKLGQERNELQRILQATQALLEGRSEDAAAFEKPQEYRVAEALSVATAWTFDPTGHKDGARVDGVLREKDLGRGSGPGGDIAIGDLVFVTPDDYFPLEDAMPADQMWGVARSHIDRMIANGVTLTLQPSTTQSGNDLARKIVTHLRDRGYTGAGTNTWVPGPVEARTAAERSLESTLTSSRVVTAQHRVLGFAHTYFRATENAAFSVNDGLVHETILAAEEVQVSRYANFVPTRNDGHRKTLIAKLLPVLESSDGMEYFVNQATQGRKGVTEADIASMRESLMKLRDQLRAAQTDASIKLYPTRGQDFGYGDIIPLVSANDRGDIVGIHLLRHGYLPADERLIVGRSLPKGNSLHSDLRLTTDSAEIDSSLTARRGRVTTVDWAGRSGLHLEIEVPLNELGAKVFEDGTGMKYVVSASSTINAPSRTVIGGKSVGYVTDFSGASKDARRDWLNSISDIAMFVGFDTRPFIASALHRITGNPDLDPAVMTSPEARDRANAAVLEVLHRFARENAGLYRAADVLAQEVSPLTEKLSGHVLSLLSEQLEVPVNEMQSADFTIFHYVLMGLATRAENVTPEDAVARVMSTPGLVQTTRQDAVSHEMNPVFTSLLQRLPREHPARKAFIEQVNARLNAGFSEVEGLYELNDNLMWDETMTLPDGTVRVLRDGMLDFSSLRAAHQNQAFDGPAQDRKQVMALSRATSAMAMTTYGARVLAESYSDGHSKTVPSAPPDLSEQAMLARALNPGVAASPYVDHVREDLPRTPDEIEYMNNRARPSAAAMRVPVNSAAWFSKKNMPKERAGAARAEYEALFTKVQERLRIPAHRRDYLETLLRIISARPGDREDVAKNDYLSLSDAMRSLKLLERNTMPGQEVWPLTDAPVRIIPRDILDSMFKGGYPMRQASGASLRQMTQWDAWVDEMLSQVFSPDPELRHYDALTHVIDGFLADFRRDVDGLPASVDSRNAELLKGLRTRTGELISNPSLRARFDNPSVAAGETVTRASDLASQPWQIEHLPSDARAVVETRMARWEKKTAQPRREKQSSRAAMRNGAKVREELGQINTLSRTVELVYVLKTMANPGLFPSAMIEFGISGTRERMVSWLDGTSAMSGGLSREERTHWRRVRDRLASDSQFFRQVYENTMYLSPPGETRTNAALQRWTTKAAALFSDPTHGTRGKALASSWMEAAWHTLQSHPLDQRIDLSTFLAILESSEDPLGTIKKYSPDAVRHGFTRIATARMLHETLPSRWIRRGVDHVVNNTTGATNLAAVIGLRIPTMFTTFRINTAVAMMGLQMPLAVIHTLFSERTRRPGGLLARMRGEDLGDPETSDAATIEDSYDLTRAIIRSGVSHTQLFTASLLLGGLGFAGDDDDEERKLANKLKRYQHTPVAKDPLSLENDFRNATAWFSDLFPAGMAHPTWFIKMFVSPVMGLMRFQETGDLRQVYWGFADALGNMPLLNTRTVTDSWQIATELLAAAESESMDESIGATDRAMRLLIASVGTLESMLFESAFLSMIYQASDDWDRDPYAIPKVENDGSLMVDKVTQEPVETKALQDNPRYGEPGMPEKGYAKRKGTDALLRGLAENRPILASLLALIKADSTYLRQNMVVKTRRVDSQALSLDEAKSLTMSILNNQTGREELTLEGAKAVVRGFDLGTVNKETIELQNIFIPQAMRDQIRDDYLTDMTDHFVALGYTKGKALTKAKELFYGQAYGEKEDGDKTYGLADLLYGKDSPIPFNESQEYKQLNTTYVTGPGGLPIATGLKRNMLTAAGLMPFEFYHTGESSNIGVDQLLNSVDSQRGINLGMRGLVKVDKSWTPKTDEELANEVMAKLDELGDRLTDAIGNSGYGRWSRRGRGGGGRGGGGYFNPRSFVPNFGGDAVRIFMPRGIEPARQDDLYSINTSNPIIRRATLRRERFSSERGRLNQWQ